ncbi:MAG: thioredoxin family protein [Thermoanaerobaculia bacterium]
MRRLLVCAAAVLFASVAVQAAGKTGGLKWREIAQGEAEAKKTGKPALYFFTAEWCGPCHAIQREVFADPKVAAAIEKRYVPILCEDRFRQDGANPPGFDDLASRFSLRGFPTLIVARPGSAKGFRLTGWPGADETREFLDVSADRLREREAEAAKAKATGVKP